MLLFSKSSFALESFLKQQSIENLSIGLYSLMGLIAALVIAVVLVSKLLLNKLRDAREHHQDLVENLPSGLLHVNIAGKIVYLNEVAAKQIGRHKDKLINSDFSENFEGAARDALEAGLSERNSSVKARAKSSNLYLAVQVGKTISINDNLVTIVTLSNQNTLQRDFNKTADHRNHLAHLIDAGNFARVYLDTQNDNYKHDKRFDDLLALNVIEEDSDHSESSKIADFLKHIHNHDMDAWKEAFSSAKANGAAAASVRMRIAGDDENVIYTSLHVDIIADQATQEDDEQVLASQKHTRFTLLVRAHNEQEEQARRLALAKEQRVAMLTVNPNAAYALDDNGNILWANERFKSMLRRVLPNSPSKNLLDMKPFPENIMQLHKRDAFRSISSYEKEFEIKLNEAEILYLKLDIASYEVVDRLNGHAKIGMVAVLQDLSQMKQTRSALKHEKDRASKALHSLSAREDELDVTSRKLADTTEQLNHTTERLTYTTKELTQSKERLQNLLDLSPVAIATINSDDKIISANRVMLERFKYNEKELKKGNIYKLFSDPAEAGTTAKVLNKKGRLHDFHVKIKGKDNHIYPGELTAELIDEENQEYLVWIIDRSDEQFQRDKFESVLQHSDMAMAIMDTSGFSKVNQAACTLFGAEDEEDLFGIYPFASQFNISHKEADTLEKALEQLKSSRQVLSMPWTHKVGDRLIPCAVTYVPIFKDQAFDSILCVWRDERAIDAAEKAQTHAIEQRKEAESVLQEKQALLKQSEQALAQRSEALESTEQALLQAQEDLSHTQAEFSQLQESYEDTSQKLHALEQAFEDSRVKLHDAEHLNAELSSQYEQASEQVAELTQQQATLKAALEQSEANCQQAQQALDATKENVDNLAQQKSSQESQVQDLANEVAQAKQALEDKQSELAQLNERLDTLNLELQTSTEGAQALQEQLASEREARQNIELERQQAEQKCEQAQQALDETKTQQQRLQEELAALEDKATQEQSDIQAHQSQLSFVLEARLKELADAQSELAQAKADLEKEQQEKEQHLASLDALNDQMSSIQANINEQQKMLSNSDEQWRAQCEQIEAQKAQLEASLKANEEQNRALDEELDEKRKALDEVTTQAKSAQAKESELQQALSEAQQKIQEYEQSIAVKEQQEQAQIEQMLAQQRSLEDKESTIIEQAISKQKALAEKLAAVEQEYADSKQNLEQQNNNQSLLSEKLQALEASLAQSQQELANKVEALSTVQEELAASKQNFEAQEKALLAEHHKALEEQVKSVSSFARPHIAKLFMPARPGLWFDLVEYLKAHPLDGSLPDTLNGIIEQLESHISDMEKAIADNDESAIKGGAKKLSKLANNIGSDALKQLIQSIVDDCENGMVDNISIRWPATKNGLQMTMRVVYSHLAA
ncbi:PAS domain-containing protein [Glaciecola sp. XM2]|uniref:PAS domain-containing protein n=1 Tax=Glaciecola sp. XM2 TaxID=1914931 RepID=UPI001BDE9913|nr:PAS domain-containing protein [Glaciecola sp. XM2]MBT1451879.1 PAS domain-containing protein [Glaciecola sp. XM2]